MGDFDKGPEGKNSSEIDPKQLEIDKIYYTRLLEQIFNDEIEPKYGLTIIGEISSRAAKGHFAWEELGTTEDKAREKYQEMYKKRLGQIKRETTPSNPFKKGTEL
ncbi:MAG: hypothetical protein N4A38_05885 [Candidatus Gracilibacteria bacterium]|nr:hypothetical protein [Candidatus Gracilibacteria bacterium]